MNKTFLICQHNWNDESDGLFSFLYFPRKLELELWHFTMICFSFCFSSFSHFSMICSPFSNPPFPLPASRHFSRGILIAHCADSILVHSNNIQRTTLLRVQLCFVEKNRIQITRNVVYIPVRSS